MNKFFQTTLDFLLIMIHDILATHVQAELGKPSLMQPDKGKVSIHIDCSSTAEPAFEVAYFVACLPPFCFYLVILLSTYSGFLHIIIQVL